MTGLTSEVKVLTSVPSRNESTIVNIFLKGLAEVREINAE
jgi:hypothetical protein